MAQEKMILDLGCGNKKRPGSIGMDINNRTAADIVHDLNVFPYPIEDSTFDEVYMDNSLEHLNDVIKVMEEIHRICKAGALIKIMVPYFRSIWAFGDSTHVKYFTVRTFEIFDPESTVSTQYDYTRLRFKKEKIVFNERLSNGFVKGMIIKYANKNPFKYEYYFSHLIPLDELSYYLRKV